jgi:GNAT superfamily N-acetyltransferase
VLATLDSRPAACSVAVPASDDTWRIAFTGVAPGVRRRGVAVAIKTELERRARAAGVRYLRTNTLSDNHAIKAVNRSLGYHQVRGILRLWRD